MMCTVYDIPPEIISHIVSYVDLKSYISLRISSKIFRVYTNDKYSTYIVLLRSATPRDIAIGMKLSTDDRDIDTMRIFSYTKCKPYNRPIATLELVLYHEKKIRDEIEDRDDTNPITEILIDCFSYYLKTGHKDISIQIFELFVSIPYRNHRDNCYRFYVLSLDTQSLDVLDYMIRNHDRKCMCRLILRSIRYNYPIECIKFLLGCYTIQHPMGSGTRYRILQDIQYHCKNSEVANYLLDYLKNII